MMSTMQMRTLSAVMIAVGWGFVTSVGAAAADNTGATRRPMLVQSSQYLGYGEGWASDGGQILFTHDGGATWRDITPAELPGQIQEIAFADGASGWVVASDRQRNHTLRVLSTTDGGTRWVETGSIEMPDGLLAAQVSSVSFADKNTGWLMLISTSSESPESTRLYRTTNAGRTWQPLPTPPSAGTVHFDSATVGRLNAFEGEFSYWQTQDGGLSWWPADGIATDRNLQVPSNELLEGALTADETVVEAQYGSAGDGWATVLGGLCESDSRCIQYTRLLSFNERGGSEEITPEAAASSISYARAGSQTPTLAGDVSPPTNALAKSGFDAVPQALPSVSLIHVVIQSQVEPSQGNQPAFGDEYTRNVQQALVAQGISTSVDGWFGNGTRGSYRTWQRRLGYSGLDASGTPGPTSLTQLGRNRFVVSGRYSIGSRVSFRGVTVNERTRAMVYGAERILGYQLTFTQGSYHPGVPESAGVHDGGGALDVRTDGWPMSKVWQTVKALRQVGFAAWYRHPPQLRRKHIHAMAIGDYDINPGIATDQIGDYLVGKDGLEGHRPDETPAAYRVPFTWWERTEYYRPF